MYNGYMLKIEGTVFPSGCIAKGTFKCQDAERVVETWVDASKVEHEITTGTQKATLSFSIAEHDSDQHAAIVQFLQKKDDIEVEFYSDTADAYRTGRFRLKAIDWNHRSSYGGKIQYGATAVKLVEN